jgi:hypothetical protein
VSNSLDKLPDDVRGLIHEAELDSVKRAHRLMDLLLKRAARWNIQIEELSAPITICGGQPHKVIDVVVPLEQLDEWLEHIRSPLKVYRVFENQCGSLLIKVCECTGPPHALEYLAREAE